MNTHTHKKNESKGRSMAHEGTQKNTGVSPLQFIDQRPEAIAQYKLQEAANQSSKVKQLKALQAMANNKPVQLFKGAADTNQAGADIPFTFAQEFTDKHIAADETGAIANTQTRIDDVNDVGGQLVKAGTIGNTVATNATWTAAINANTDVIPEIFMGPSAADKADPGYSAADYDDSGHTSDSSHMPIAAWEVTYDSDDDELSAEQKTVNRRVSGNYTVTNLDVSIDIDHCTQ